MNRKEYRYQCQAEQMRHMGFISDILKAQKQTLRTVKIHWDGSCGPAKRTLTYCCFECYACGSYWSIDYYLHEKPPDLILLDRLYGAVTNPFAGMPACPHIGPFLEVLKGEV